MKSDGKPNQGFTQLSYHINNCPLAFIEWDKDFRIKQWSPKAQEIFGYAPEEVKGLHPLALDFFEKTSRQLIWEKIIQLKKGKVSNNILETSLYTKEGEHLWVELYNSAYLNKDGQLISAVSFVQDITKRKMADEQIRKNEMLLSQLFINSPIGIAMLDEEDCILNINNSFEHIFGYTLEEARGHKLNELIAPDSLMSEARQLSTEAHSGRILQTETVRRRKDGSRIPVLVGGLPVYYREETIAIYGMYVDISERKEAEEKIKKSLKEKETLLAEIHHRVKNNLAVISGLLQLQAFNSENDEVEQALNDSRSRIMSIATVHERLYQSEALSEIDCREFIRQLCRTIHSTHCAESKNIRQNLNIQPISLNVTQAIPMGLILNELLVNAYKHAFTNLREGSIEVNLTNKNNIISLEVRDDGPGIPEDINLTDPQSLGMTLIDTLTKQLQATLTMDRKNGTCFTLKFTID